MEIANEILLYVYLGIFLGMTLYLFCYAIYDERKKKDLEEKREFYFRQKNMGEGFRKKGNTIVFSCFMWILIAGMLFLVAYVMAECEAVRKRCRGMGEMVANLPEVMLAGLGAITMLSGFIGFRKDTWIGLNGDVILRRYGVIKRFKQILFVVGTSYIVLFASIFIKNGEGSDRLYFAVKSLLLYVFVSYLYLFIKCIWSMLDILTGEKIACRRIKALYQEFWYNSISRVERGGREEEIIRMLLKNHKEVACRVNLIQKIVDVEFDTNIKASDLENGRYEKLGLKSYRVFFSIYFFSFFVGGFAFLNQCNKSARFFIPCIVFFCSTFVLGVSLVLLGLHSKGMRIAAISIAYGRCGYRFIRRRGRDKYVREVPWVTTKYDRYVQVTKSFLAFVLMHLKSGHEDVLKMIIKECKRKLRDNPNLYADISMLLVVMDYMYYRETKKFLDDIEFSEEYREYYTKIAKAFAVDTMDDIFGGKVDMTMFDEYIVEREKYLDNKKKKEKVTNVHINIALPQKSKVNIRSV